MNERRDGLPVESEPTGNFKVEFGDISELMAYAFNPGDPKYGLHPSVGHVDFDPAQGSRFSSVWATISGIKRYDGYQYGFGLQSLFNKEMPDSQQFIGEKKFKAFLEYLKNNNIAFIKSDADRVNFPTNFGVDVLLTHGYLTLESYMKGNEEMLKLSEHSNYTYQNRLTKIENTGINISLVRHDANRFHVPNKAIPISLSDTKQAEKQLKAVAEVAEIVFPFFSQRDDIESQPLNSTLYVAAPTNIEKRFIGGEAEKSRQQTRTYIEPKALPQALKPETNASLPTKKSEKSNEQKEIMLDDIKGQDEAVAEARSFVRFINNPELYKKRAADPITGILFYGPPGTGKTRIAHAIANEVNATFVPVVSTDFGSSFQNASENNFKEIFDSAIVKAMKGEKIILFFDEIDSILRTREDSHSSNTDKKIVNVFNTSMNEIAKRNLDNIFILGATNLLDEIDSAAKRRFSRHVMVPLPNSEGCSAILNYYVEEKKSKSLDPEELFSAIDLESLGILAEKLKMSGDDINKFLNKLITDKTDLEADGTPWTPISTEELAKSMIKFKNSGHSNPKKTRLGFNN